MGARASGAISARSAYLGRRVRLSAGADMAPPACAVTRMDSGRASVTVRVRVRLRHAVGIWLWVLGVRSEKCGVCAAVCSLEIREASVECVPTCQTEGGGGLRLLSQKPLAKYKRYRHAKSNPPRRRPAVGSNHRRRFSSSEHITQSTVRTISLSVILVSSASSHSSSSSPLSPSSSSSSASSSSASRSS